MGTNLQKISKGISLPSLGSAPSSPVNGDFYYDSTLGFQFRQAAAWTGLGSASSGSGGPSSLRWVESGASADPLTENNNAVYVFAAAITQNLFATIRVPNSYAGGTQIKLRIPIYSSSSSGTALLQSIATLIRTGTDAITSTTNQRTSTNSAITLSGGTVSIPQSIVLDLTDSTGKINSVTVSAGDTIQVSLTRGTDTSTGDLKVMVYDSEVTTT